MAYPVPYTENWKDNFGQQNYPVPPADSSKVPPVEFTGGGVQGDGTELAINFTGGSGNFMIQWSDGSPEEETALTSATHTYTRNGSYLIRIRDRDFPSNNWMGRFRVSVPALYPSPVGPGGVLGGTSGGTSVDPAPPPTLPVIYGPFSSGGDGTPFWTDADCMVGFDIDSDSDADVWYTWEEVVANEAISTETKDAIYAQLQSQGCTG